GGRRRGRAALGAAVALHRLRRREDRRRRAARGAEAEGRRARLRARVRGPRRLTLADERWAAVDRYLTGVLVPPDPVLDDALRACAEAGMPAAEVSPTQGKLLQLLARLAGARRILELGTLGGYGTIWRARALPDGGRLVTLEADPGYAEGARSNLARAGLAGVVEIRVGPALDTLPELDGPFDLIFIDADKANNAEYLGWALALARPGTLIVGDNVVRDGEIAD